MIHPKPNQNPKLKPESESECKAHWMYRHHYELKESSLDSLNPTAQKGEGATLTQQAIGNLRNWLLNLTVTENKRPPKGR